MHPAFAGASASAAAAGGYGGGLEGQFDDAGSVGGESRHLAALASRLREPVDLSSVALRVVGGGKQAAYLPGEKAVSTANEIFGFASW